uniref:PRA1 family protein n=1 Tax=Brassica oleracea var. oleracea TaxID=109376 RepID=A0A0D3CQY6_BRAOL
MNYGAIPTSSHPSPPIDLEYISRAKHRIKSGLATRRPWKTMFDLQSMSLPHGFFDAISRIKTNLVYFRANYAVVVLLVLFLSLIYHPTSLLVLAVLVVFWIFLYFLRDEPLVVFGHQIDDRTVMICLSVLTIVMLLFTHATANVLGAVATAVVLVLVHAAVRRSDNLYLDEEAAAATEASGLTLSSKIHSLTQKLSKTNAHVSSIPSPLKSSLPSSATPRINRSTRVPVELSSCVSLFPLHSAIASSRLVSSLSAESMSWGLVPQGISMPL